MLGMDFIPVAPTSVELQEIPMDPSHFLRQKDKSTNPCVVPKALDWELEFQPWIQRSQRSSSPAPSHPTSTDPEFPPGDPQPSQEFQILTPMTEEIRSKAEISRIFNKENFHPDPGLCSRSKLRKTEGHPGIFHSQSFFHGNALPFPNFSTFLEFLGKFPAQKSMPEPQKLWDLLSRMRFLPWNPKNCSTHP